MFVIRYSRYKFTPTNPTIKCVTPRCFRMHRSHVPFKVVSNISIPFKCSEANAATYVPSDFALCEIRDARNVEANPGPP